jgi:disulfide bond formation protein DsbB
MSTDTLSLFFALLSLLCVAAVAVVVVLVLVARSAGSDSGAARLVGDLRRVALPLAATVAVVTSLGSLYFSEIAEFTPCELCWFQRICMYPLAVILTVAAVRRDNGIRTYALPLATIGAAISTYHTWLQAFPDRTSSFCTLEAPCTDRYVWELGFVSLPFMALTAFAFVITMMLLVPRRPAGVAAAEPELQEVET